MGLRDFAQRAQALDVALLTLDGWGELDEALAEQRSVQSLAEEQPEGLASLPRDVRLATLRCYRRYATWLEERRGVEAQREEQGRPALPESVLAAASGEGALGALLRAAEAFPPGADAPGDGPGDAWADILGEALELWQRSLSLCLRDGAVTTALNEDSELADDFAGLAPGDHGLGDLPGYRWQALRRGERAGALSLSISLPTERLQEQLALAGWDSEERSAAARHVILDALPGAVAQTRDSLAAREAIEGAGRAYCDLLGAPALAAARAGGVFVGSARRSIGLAVVDREGFIESSARIAPTQGWEKRVAAWFSSEGVTHIAVPTQARAREHLEMVRNALADGRTLVPVRPAALAEARDAIREARGRMAPEAAAAAALAQRAMVPSAAWAMVDPVGIGLAEYQADLDQDALRAELELVLTLFEAEHAGPVGVGRIAGAASGSGGNLVRSIKDLRPGMQIGGTITNLTRFGAFVDVGLSEQGLIHISDLADHFVQDPGEVVRPGQQVNARVLRVDAGRGRISLSLKSEQPARGGRRGGRADSGGGRPGGGRPRRGGDDGGDRRGARRALDDLFGDAPAPSTPSAPSTPRPPSRPQPRPAPDRGPSSPRSGKRRGPRSALDDLFDR